MFMNLFMHETSRNIVLQFSTILNWIAMNFKLNPNRIVYVQIKSFTTQSNLHKWFNRDLNQIAIWICPSLLKCIVHHNGRHIQLYLNLQNWRKRSWRMCSQQIKLLKCAKNYTNQSKHSKDVGDCTTWHYFMPLCSAKCTVQCSSVQVYCRLCKKTLANMLAMSLQLTLSYTSRHGSV